MATFGVNTVADTVDVNPGDGVAEDADANTSLRAAIMEPMRLQEQIRLPWQRAFMRFQLHRITIMMR